MQARALFTFQIFDQAPERCVVACLIGPAAEKCPAHVQDEEVEAVGLAIRTNLADVATPDHRLDLRSMAPNLARQPKSQRDII